MLLEVPGALREQEIKEQKKHLDGTVFLSLFDPDEILTRQEEGEDGDGSEYPDGDLMPPTDLD